jgi:hypothetical protein
MRSVKNGVVLLSLLTLFGCATPQFNYSPQVTSISEPPIGSVVTVSVGDAMLKQGKYRAHDAISVKVPTKAGWAYTVNPGYYLKQGEDAAADYFQISPGLGGGSVEKAFIADPFKGVMTKKGTQILCVVTIMNVAACGDPSNFEREKRDIVSQDSFQQTLIYSGRVGSKINIAYRESSGSTARPAFNNNVEYDLNESQTIGYKGAQLEILEATNQLIRYKVIRNFNAAAF